MKITKRLLQKNKACPGQIKIFARQWPEGVEVTLESLNEAHAIGLDIFRLESLIPADKRAEYEAKRNSLWDVYKAQAMSLTAYKAQEKSLWIEYKAKQKPLSVEYNSKLAKVLAIVFNE